MVVLRQKKHIGLPVCGKNEDGLMTVQAGTAILYFHFYGIGISGSTEISTVLCAYNTSPNSNHGLNLRERRYILIQLSSSIALNY